jgi:exonuclease VII large subunit
MMPKRTAVPSSAAPLPEPEQDDWPDDIVGFRIRLASELCHILVERSGAWRHCSRGPCRRAHACKTQDGQCPALPKREPSSEQETARTMARVQRILQNPEGFVATQERHLAAHPPRERREQSARRGQKGRR